MHHYEADYRFRAERSRRSGRTVWLRSRSVGRRDTLYQIPELRYSADMLANTSRLTSIVEEYLGDLRRLRASGGATGELSTYPALSNLLNAIGATLRPKVFCVVELADQGAGHPDFGLYAASQVQRGTPRQGQTPECGVVEVKPPDDDAWLTAEGEQVSRYWDRYRLVLVTNTRDFVLLGSDTNGNPARLETFSLSDSDAAFDIYLNDRAYWRNVPASVWNYNLGGYQVLKKWLSYRESKVLGRGPRPEEVQHFTDTARRIVAILKLVN